MVIDGWWWHDRSCSDFIKWGGLFILCAYRSDRFDEAIIAYVRRTFGSSIGEATAERIKQEIGTACIDDDDEIKEIEVHGHTRRKAHQWSFKLTSRDVLEAIQQTIKWHRHRSAYRTWILPAGISKDIFERGVWCWPVVVL